MNDDVLADAAPERAFSETLDLLGVVVLATACHALCKDLRRLGALFDRPRLRSVVLTDSVPASHRLVLLHEGALSAEVSAFLAERSLETRPHKLHLGYDHWPAEHVLRVRGHHACARLFSANGACP